MSFVLLVIVRFEQPGWFHANFTTKTGIKVHGHFLRLFLVLYSSVTFTLGTPTTIELGSR